MGLSRNQMPEIAKYSIRFINVRVRTDTLTATNVSLSLFIIPHGA